MDQEKLNRLVAAVQRGTERSLISEEQMIEALEILAKSAEYDLKPKDILLNGLYDYPEMLSQLDVLHYPEVDNAFMRFGWDKDGIDFPGAI